MMKTLAVIGHEVLDFLIIVLLVWVIGIFFLYREAIVLWREEVTWSGKKVVQVQSIDESLDKIADTQKKKEFSKKVEEMLEWLGKEIAVNVADITLEDILASRIDEYEFAFNDLPPGRRLSVPSVWIEAPIVEVEYASEEKMENGDFEVELREGVVKYPFTSIPWQDGNSLIFWHSSVTSWESSKNPFGYIFYKLPKMAEGETFEVIRDGSKYSYVIEAKKIVEPEEVGGEVEKYDQKGERYVTLMACYPLLSTAQRIMLVAKQVPTNAKQYGNIFSSS